MTPEPNAPLASTETSTSLLAGLRDPANNTAWTDFVGRYRPLLLRYVVRVGVSPSDAEDVVQASLLAFSRAYVDGKYERSRGRLRSWLFGIVHNQVRKWWGKRGADRLAAGNGGESGGLSGIAAPDESEALWEAEWRDAVLAQCLDAVRKEVGRETFEAFRRFAVDGEPAETVATSLGMTPNAVYCAKRRLLRRARELYPLMEEVW